MILPGETEAGSAGTQPARDSPADGVPLLHPHLALPARVGGPGACCLPPRHIRAYASENPGGLGAEPPRRHPSPGLLLPGSPGFFFLFIDSRKR
jgi:hypothetical protein